MEALGNLARLDAQSIHITALGVPQVPELS